MEPGRRRFLLLRMASAINEQRAAIVLLTGTTIRNLKIAAIHRLRCHSTFLYDEMPAEENLDLLRSLWSLLIIR